MSNQGLAAVHAAATPPAAPAAAAPATPATAAVQPMSVAELSAAFPDLCAQLRAEGAGAERSRLLGIEAHAMPGHESLIAACKADASCTPDMAAGRVIVAEKALRDGALGAIAKVEPAAAAVRPAPAASAAPDAQPTATTPEGWKTEFAAATPAGEKLRGEFASADDYVAFKANESKVRILGARK